MSAEVIATSCIDEFDSKSHEFKIFMEGVSNWFATHPALRGSELPIVHSVKSRLKDRDHLKAKIVRKINDGVDITRETFFDKVTDLAGVRVLHLYQEQFHSIHDIIRAKVYDQKDWFLPEQPMAYTWDPESTQFFEGLGIRVEVKPSFYTSVHYLVRPRENSPICCEIQIRTLFEEIWGEVDHALNYPDKSQKLACREQLLVLAKLVGAGSRLVDSIFRISMEGTESQNS